MVTRSPLSTRLETGEFDGGIPAETLARILLAIVDGLMLHAAAAPKGMRWPRLRQGVDGLLAELRAGGPRPGVKGRRAVR